MLERKGDPDVHEWWWRHSPSHGEPTRQLLVRGACENTERFEVGGKYCSVGPLSLRFVSFDRYRKSSLELSTADLRALSERLVISQGAGGADIPFPHFDMEWRYEDFAGGGHLFDAIQSPRCSGKGRGALEKERAFRAIPAVSLPSGFVTREWKTVDIGGCGLALGGSAFPGYLLAGMRDGEDVLFRAVLSPPDMLFIEVTGLGAGSNGATASPAVDRLEVWQAEKDAGNGEMPAHQWLIGIPSGKVEPGHGGTAKSPTVEVANKPGRDGGARLALKIKLPYALEVAPSLSISVSKSGGQRPRYLLSTSELCFGQGETIGPVQRIRPDLARCEVRKGLLEPNLQPVLDSAEPFVRW
ncbi:hypothetical protein LY474_17360 [Myxococcus stipitatus]|uniref:hypothetical protein n=1 Tax=Myxococcus stipitatus TaxID=83455 RepID=UPI001F47E5CC|nr:hypothetical protein [Myxococcus stipitatus]MCE9669565.1 hypothetical protein [Myxococcus stipitatus]